MSWITLPDGHEMSLSWPRHDDIDVRRLAHSISQIVRFNGATCRPYSVAEHSLLVLHIARHHLGLDVHGQLAALVHDLHEAITGDQASPTKAEIGPGWGFFEAKMERLVIEKLGLVTARYANTAAIVTADMMALAIERTQLMPSTQPNGMPSTPWPCLARVPLINDVNLMSTERTGKTWVDWRDEFVAAYDQLDAERRTALAARSGAELAA